MVGGARGSQPPAQQKRNRPSQRKRFCLTLALFSHNALALFFFPPSSTFLPFSKCLVPPNGSACCCSTCVPRARAVCRCAGGRKPRPRNEGVSGGAWRWVVGGCVVGGRRHPCLSPFPLDRRHRALVHVWCTRCSTHFGVSDGGWCCFATQK